MITVFFWETVKTSAMENEDISATFVYHHYDLLNYNA